jgi:hypothetical protein
MWLARVRTGGDINNPFQLFQQVIELCVVRHREKAFETLAKDADVPLRQEPYCYDTIRGHAYSPTSLSNRWDSTTCHIKWSAAWSQPDVPEQV